MRIKRGLNFKVLVILLIFLLGFLLRLHNFAQYPQRGATHDEFTFAFLGISFLQTGIPTSWSNIPIYQNKYYLEANDTRYSIVIPYFDHPPFFGFLTGGLALLNGETDFSAVELSTIRLVPVLLGSLSIILIFLLCRSLYDFKAAVISSLVFATVPTYVISSRMALAENLLIPEILLALILFEKFVEQKKKSLVYLLGFLSGLAFLTKFVGLFVYLSLFFLFLSEPKLRKNILPLSVVAFLVGSFYFLYGLALDKNLFLKILSFQGAREVGPYSFFNLFLTPAIVNKIFVDGWVYFGWFALIILISRGKENLKVVIPALCYLLIFVLTVNQKDLHGWYNYPFYPFLAIASGKLISQMIDKPSFLNVIFLLTAGFSTLNLTYFNLFGLSPTLFRILVLLFFLPFFFEAFRIRKLDRFAQKLFVFYLAVLIFLNIVSVITYIHPA